MSIQEIVDSPTGDDMLVPQGGVCDRCGRKKLLPWTVRYDEMLGLIYKLCHSCGGEVQKLIERSEE